MRVRRLGLDLLDLDTLFLLHNLLRRLAGGRCWRFADMAIGSSGDAGGVGPDEYELVDIFRVN
jgi:hypothetical protein